jgi:hypothetical protein
MKLIHSVIIACAIMAAGGVSALADQALVNKLDKGVYGQRVCIPARGESTKLSVSSSASTQLESGTIYEMTCDGTTGVYYEFGVAAPTADSSSQYLAEDVTIYFAAEASDVYLAAVDVGAAAGNCFIRACR